MPSVYSLPLAVLMPALRTVQLREMRSPLAALAGPVNAFTSRSDRPMVSGTVKVLLASDCSLTSPLLSVTKMSDQAPSAALAGSCIFAVVE